MLVLRVDQGTKTFPPSSAGVGGFTEAHATLHRCIHPLAYSRLYLLEEGYLLNVGLRSDELGVGRWIVLLMTVRGLHLLQANRNLYLLMKRTGDSETVLQGLLESYVD